MSWSQTTGASSSTGLPTNFMSQQYGTGRMVDLDGRRVPVGVHGEHHGVVVVVPLCYCHTRQL